MLLSTYILVMALLQMASQVYRIKFDQIRVCSYRVICQLFVDDAYTRDTHKCNVYFKMLIMKLQSHG
jgi:hypothetical protein